MIYEPNKKTNIKIFSVNELYIYIYSEKKI